MALLEKTKKWFSDKYNFAFFFVLLFAIGIRLYYFFQTLGQPLWWDEAEYLLMARVWAFGWEGWEIFAVRPVLLPFLTSIFFRIVESEIWPRLIVLISSIASVPAMYYLGKEMYGKMTGLIASIFISVFWLDLFYSMRILPDSISLTFYLLSTIFFWKYFKGQGNKFLYIASVLIAFGVLFRLTTGVLIIMAGLFVLVTQRFKIFKKKEFWIATGIFILILLPYIIWGFVQFNSFIITEAGAHNAPTEKFSGTWYNLDSYFSMIPGYLGLIILVLAIIGVVLMYSLILAPDLLIKGENKEMNRDLFVLLLFLGPILSYSLSFGKHTEDRYIIASFALVFLVASSVIARGYEYFKKHNKLIAGLVCVALILFVVFSQVSMANNTIEAKKTSFWELKQGGIWLEENTDEDVKIFSAGGPMLEYYAKRDNIHFPETKEEFESRVTEHSDKKVYFVLSAVQRGPEWSYNYPDQEQMKVVQAYFLDSNKRQPILVIYEL